MDVAAVLDPPLITSKFQSDLKVNYSPPYLRRVWYYVYANTAQVKNALASFNLEQALSNSPIDKKISVHNETIISVMCNYIPNEVKISDDQNPP